MTADGPSKPGHQTVQGPQLGQRMIKEDEAKKWAGPTTLLEKRARPMPIEGPGRQKLSNFFFIFCSFVLANYKNEIEVKIFCNKNY